MRSAESCTGFNPELKLSGSEDEEMEHDDMKESTNEDLDNCLGKDAESVQSRLFPRGHWRPAEDEKLRELVSQYGPQNWNLIAEKLQGRSGTNLHPLDTGIIPNVAGLDHNGVNSISY